MIKKKYLILTLMLSLLCINKTYAACTQEEINEFKKIEDEYKVTYEFNKNTKDYTLKFNNPLSEKYIYIINYDMECKVLDEKNFECYNVSANEYKIEVAGMTATCYDSLKEITLNLAEYNNYSDDPLCEGIEEFYLCQETYDKQIDRETFESRVNTYKKTKEKENQKQNQDTNEEKNELIQYIEDNLTQIIIVVIFIVLVIITTIITVNSIRKSRRLE